MIHVPPLLRSLLALGAVACSIPASAASGDAPAAAPRQAVAPADPLALGQRLYREGLRASGAPLTGVGAAQTRLEGRTAACATCHRRSGYGTAEGRFTVRPIIGPALLQVQTTPVHSPRVKARLGTAQRAPYTEALLVRAIREGFDASGRPLDPVMPRYELNDTEAAALAAYLFALSAQPSPGVDEHEIHFATVIQPDVSAERRRAMLDVMEAFIRDKDANMRSDERRRDAGNMRMYRAYRKWVLHVWQLSGPAETWNAQLEAFYRQQPVFALIGGLGAANWQPIHEFGERFEIPSVFPLAEMPPATGPNQYSFYLSRGTPLEAEVLAKFLREQVTGGPIVQVYRRDDAGAAAAAAFRAALAASPAGELKDQVLDGTPDARFWNRISQPKPAALVLWLHANDLEGVTVPDAAELYLSAGLVAGRIPDAVWRASTNVRLVYPSDVPPRRDARLLRNKVWLHSKGIALTDEAVQINTQFLMTVVSDVLGHLMDSFSRDYFVERIEHTVGQTPMASTFQSVSLGPGQRFAAKGSAIVHAVDADAKHWKALSGWIVP